jgi:cyclopropane-fatty-acyl-phospholipid synthase
MEQPSAPRPSTSPERWIVRRILHALGDPPVAIALWDGHEVVPRDARPQMKVHLHDRRALRHLLLRPDPDACDDYCQGRIEIEGDLLHFLDAIFAGGLQPRSRARSRRNIYSHYDLGNDFYRLWLDERLLYTCAYFPSPEVGLEEAQLAKMDHVCRKLALRPGEKVIEAGCGWGSLALHMAEHYGVRVRAFNISREQIAYAREEARRRGLEKQVEFVEDDYRGARDTYDAFVSVGMLEHVGRRHYGLLSRVIDRCLAPHGRGLVHSIGRARAQAMSPWIERTIFPGAYIPALREMMAVFEPRNFAVLDVENLRLHYARTLEHWLERFEKVADQVEARFDAAFVRTWRLYLAGSIAAFRSGSTQLYQIVFSRAGNDAIPWTRAGVYEGS